MRYILSFLLLVHSVTGLAFMDVVQCKMKKGDNKYDLEIFFKTEPILGFNFSALTQYHVKLKVKEKLSPSNFLDRLADELLDEEHFILDTAANGGQSIVGDLTGGFTVRKGTKSYKFRFRNNKQIVLISIATDGTEDKDELAFNKCTLGVQDET